ncbi:hypothetical protein ABK040_011081 [Willaertia magna]
MSEGNNNNKKEEEQHQQIKELIQCAFDPYNEYDESKINPFIKDYQPIISKENISLLNNLQLNALQYIIDNFKNFKLFKIHNEILNRLQIITDIKEEEQIENEELLFRKYAEDYGHVIHQIPVIVFIPESSIDISNLIKLIVKWNKNNEIKIQIVLRGSGGNVCGASQIGEFNEKTLQILIDMSSKLNKLSEIKTIDNNFSSIWTDAGVLYDKFVKFCNEQNFRPIVIPDYLKLTIGGVLSIGGLGSDTFKKGLCAEHILEMEIINGEGEILICSPFLNEIYFNSILCGLGQFGIITKVNMKLEKLLKFTKVFHYLFLENNKMFKKIKEIYKKDIDITCQTFMVPRNLIFIKNWVFFGIDHLMENYQNCLQKILELEEYNYFHMLEFSVRYNNENEIQNIKEIINKIFENEMTFENTQMKCELEMTTLDWDNRVGKTSVPALVQFGNWLVPHVWLNIIIPDNELDNFTNNILKKLNPQRDLGFGHIGFNPLNYKHFNLPYFGLPQLTTSKEQTKEEDNWCYIIVFGRDAFSKEQVDLHFEQNEKIWRSVENASIYPTSILRREHWKEEDWKKHFGEEIYRDFKEKKLILDPYEIFVNVRGL